MARPLEGFTVVSTRPLGQASRLDELLRTEGAFVVPFPTLDIVPVEPEGGIERAREDVQASDLVLFVSANAVDGLLRGTRDRSFLGPPRVGAVGSATAARLAHYGVRVDLVPSGAGPRGYGSEALLELPGLSLAAVTGQRVLIVRGRGGRAGLGTTLGRRGARVRYLELYQRVPARPSAAARREVLASAEPMVVVVTSEAGLAAFWEVIAAGETAPDSARVWLESRRYLAVSGRLAEAVARRGVRPPALVAPRASDAAIRDTLVAHARSGRWRDTGGD